MPRELVIATVDDARRNLLARKIDGGAMIDASQVESIDLAGLQLLVAIADQAGARGNGFVAVSPQVEAAMRRAGIRLPATN